MRKPGKYPAYLPGFRVSAGGVGRRQRAETQGRAGDSESGAEERRSALWAEGGRQRGGGAAGWDSEVHDGERKRRAGARCGLGSEAHDGERRRTDGGAGARWGQTTAGEGAEALQTRCGQRERVRGPDPFIHEAVNGGYGHVNRRLDACLMC